jgi:hypothetical protein
MRFLGHACEAKSSYATLFAASGSTRSITSTTFSPRQTGLMVLAAGTCYPARYATMCVCVCVCVCNKHRERERDAPTHTQTHKGLGLPR